MLFHQQVIEVGSSGRLFKFPLHLQVFAMGKAGRATHASEAIGIFSKEEVEERKTVQFCTAACAHAS